MKDPYGLSRGRKKYIDPEEKGEEMPRKKGRLTLKKKSVLFTIGDYDGE